MADGSQMTIETVRVGDQVLTYDGGAGTVIDVYERQSDHVTELRYREGKEDGTTVLRRLETTDEHLFWVKAESNWLAAGDLEVGDIFSLPGGQEAEVTEIWRLESPATVYSFDVDEYESFYANGVLVRQKCGGAEETAVEQRLREIINDKGESQMPPFEGKRSEGGVP